MHKFVSTTWYNNKIMYHQRINHKLQKLIFTILSYQKTYDIHKN